MLNDIQLPLQHLAEGKDLSRDEAARAFQILMHGGATPAQMGALLLGLRQKGETADEIAGAALAARSKMIHVKAPAGAIDTCGTGGDGKQTLNISTAVAIVVAACGVPVAKHGNRAVSSRSGSADVLAALGVNTEGDAQLTEHCLQECGIAFMLAPRFHQAMRHVAPVRQELGMRTIFNLLGPLLNPAQPQRQLVGVYSEKLLEPMAKVLDTLGCSHAWVVHGEDGMDELTITGTSQVAELKQGAIRRFSVSPEEAGLPRGQAGALRGGDASANARALMTLLTHHDEGSAYRDIVLLNSAAALVVAGKTRHLAEGVGMAKKALDSGAAKEKLAQWAVVSNGGVESLGGHG